MYVLSYIREIIITSLCHRTGVRIFLFDTNDVWDNGDHVGISIFPESIKINSDCRIIIKKRGAQNDTIFLVFT